jgi:hypothetical protein
MDWRIAGNRHTSLQLLLRMCQKHARLACVGRCVLQFDAPRLNLRVLYPHFRLTYAQVSKRCSVLTLNTVTPVQFSNPFKTALVVAQHLAT